MKSIWNNQGFAAWVIGLVVIGVLAWRHIVDGSTVLGWLGGGGSLMVGPWRKADGKPSIPPPKDEP